MPHGPLLAAIVIAGALGFAKRIPHWLAASVVGILTVYGVVTSPDISTRILYLAAAAIGPLLPYPTVLAWSLTIRPLIHFMQWQGDSHRTCVLVAPGDALYDSASEQIDVHARALVSSGFLSRGRVAMTVGPNTVMNEFLDREKGTEWAIVSATLPAGVQQVVIQCSCRFADGEVLLVSNYQFVDPSADSPGFISVRLPSIDNATDVVRACQLIASRGDHGPIVATPLDTDLLARAKDRTRSRFDAEVKAGNLRYDAGRDVYRSTLPGAYGLYWRSFPPLRTSIDRRDREEEKALLDELGIKPREKVAEEAKPSRRLWLEAAALIVLLVALAGWGPELLAMIGGHEPRPRPDVSVPAGFTVPDSFPGAVQALERLVRQPSHQLSGTKDDEPFPTPGVAISMRWDSAAAFVAAAQDAFLARGFYLFRTGERYSGLDTDGLALFPASDPYEIMRAMDTNAANHSMLVEDVIAWFRREEPRYPIRFNAIGFDYAGGVLGGDLPDVNGYASRFMRFCPDLQGEGLTTRSLARDLERTREIYCWWD